ncbi:hypothetical protein KVR01_008805 [Diaporthe batatas]|uniref:uncharacterized protein n=1 Tax=Diaporthe batatas TaxID=748121 RepID=UPI001D05A154|nr:uncharacterized protein KVR01_008805 [Diaporthe batatas]KAG8161818.1 hypothetical protein KVR01_008805 [Diaporthe batatas]
MSASSRTPAPTRSYTTGSSPNTPTSPTSPTSSQGSPQSAFTSRWPTRAAMSRKDSSNSVTSTMSSASAASVPRRKKASSTSNVNTYTHCGRHTDQYLFSGWSKIFSTKH